MNFNPRRASSAGRSSRGRAVLRDQGSCYREDVYQRIYTSFASRQTEASEGKTKVQYLRPVLIFCAAAGQLNEIAVVSHLDRVQKLSTQITRGCCWCASREARNNLREYHGLTVPATLCGRLIARLFILCSISTDHRESGMRTLT